MATRNYAPRDNNEGELGVDIKWWAKCHIVEGNFTDINTDTTNTDVIETKSLVFNGMEVSFNFIKRNKTYKVNDIAYNKNTKNGVRLECVVAGTTASEESDDYSTATIGTYITDGTTKWIVCDIRDGLPYGDISYRPVLKKGYVKLNGATVQRSDYPRLVKYATDNNLWTDSPTTDIWKFGNGDGETTFVLPDYRNLFIEGGDTPAKIEAGLPNIEGSFGCTVGSNHTKYTSGAFSGVLINNNTSDAPGYSDIKDNILYGFSIDASKSSAIYGKSSTVQPPAITLIPQIKY